MINDVRKIIKTTSTSTTSPSPAFAATTTITRSEHFQYGGGGRKKLLNTDDKFTYNLPTVGPSTEEVRMQNPADVCGYSKMTNTYEVEQESTGCCLSTTKTTTTTPTPTASFNDNACHRHDGSTSGWFVRKTAAATTQTMAISDNREHIEALRGEQTQKPLSTVMPPSLASPSKTTTLTCKPSSLSTLLQNQAATALTHKNITNVPCEASCHRTLETETSAKNLNRQCEQLELTLNVASKQEEKPIEKSTSLAERKALLKREFFKDFPSSSVDSLAAKTVLSKRLLKKQHNLKLKIPPQKQNRNLLNYTDTLKPQTKNQKSLVALRKLDLQRLEVKATANNAYRDILDSAFPSVKELAKKFDYHKPPKMIVPQNKLGSSGETEMVSLKPEALDQRHSPLSDEGCNLGQSPYSSDDDNDSIRTTHTAIERIPSKRKDKVARSASSDSALGLEVDESMDTSEAPTPQQQQKRRMTLTVTDLPLRPALLPLAEPTTLPDSPTLEILPNLNQTQIPSKVLIEERVVEIPEDPRSGGSSRRESSQSCLSDFPANEMQGVRFVRTPSVVVSDYSDDIMCGITLEEIEYFRAQRMRRRRSSLDTAGTEKDALDNNSDVSASSSCSNLYYCGSTISALDGAECLVNGIRMQLERKTSDCSTCSVSGDEDTAQNFTIPEQPEDCQDLSDMLANQHLSCKRTKKVGDITTGLLTVHNTNVP